MSTLEELTVTDEYVAATEDEEVLVSDELAEDVVTAEDDDVVATEDELTVDDELFVDEAVLKSTEEELETVFLVYVLK